MKTIQLVCCAHFEAQLDKVVLYLQATYLRRFRQNYNYNSNNKNNDSMKYYQIKEGIRKNLLELVVPQLLY